MITDNLLTCSELVNVSPLLVSYHTYPILNYRFDNLQLRSSRTEYCESRSKASVIYSFFLMEELATCCDGALKWHTWEHDDIQVSGLVATRIAQYKLPKSSSWGFTSTHFSLLLS